MYAKVFRQVFESSIAEDYQTRHIFMDLIVLANSDGVVDMTHEAIARITNVPLNKIREAISALESPDPKSRTPDESGCRMKRLDDHRDWGWWIINYDKFRGTATEEKRREATRLRVKKFREKNLETTENTSNGGNALHAVTYASSSSSASALQGKESVREEGAEEVYKLYPRKVAKKYALAAIRKQIKAYGIELVMSATKRFGEAWSGATSADLVFCPHPATWFNQERFNDSPETWRPQQATKSNGNTVSQKAQLTINKLTQSALKNLP